MQTLYLVKMWEVEETGDLGPTTEVIVQLTDIEGKWFADFRQGSWAYANLALLRGLREKGLRFVGSLPNFNPTTWQDAKSFWVVTEPESLRA